MVNAFVAAARTTCEQRVTAAQPLEVGTIHICVGFWKLQ